MPPTMVALMLAVVGPAMVAAATDVAGSQRIGFVTVIGLFVPGLILLSTCKIRDGCPSVHWMRAAPTGRSRARAAVRCLI